MHGIDCSYAWGGWGFGLFSGVMSPHADNKALCELLESHDADPKATGLRSCTPKRTNRPSHALGTIILEHYRCRYDVNAYVRWCHRRLQNDGVALCRSGQRDDAAPLGAPEKQRQTARHLAGGHDPMGAQCRC